MARHRPRVAEREVDVLVAVDIGDARAARLGVEERVAADPLGHPGHRNAEDLHAARFLGERARARRALAKSARSRSISASIRARSITVRLPLMAGEISCPHGHVAAGQAP